MDTTDPAITFDAEGACNHWHDFRAFLAAHPTREERDRQRHHLVETIRARGKGKRYDCLIGLSGGIDSSYLALLAKREGLRPLSVHFDNGWNSEVAVSNIENIVSKLGLDLHTYVMEWREFQDLQRAYFKASVIDLEVPTDHMIFGAMQRIASQHSIPYVLSGCNYETEFIMPRAWAYSKRDLVNLRGIHRRFGSVPLRHLPPLGIWQQMYYRKVRGIDTVEFLNLFDYDKNAAMAELESELGWKYYGGKHFESIFTRFYQGYVLPRKFGVDKRKAHFSTLITTGRMTREAALDELRQPPYAEELQEEDKKYVAKKLGFSDDEFEAVLTQPNRSHEEYGTDAAQIAMIVRMATIARPFTRLIRKISRITR